MATTLLNNCTYPNCRKNFPNLEELIYHIEEDHIDFSLAEIELQTEPEEFHCVPLSYVLKYSQLHPKLTHNKESYKEISSNNVVPIKLEEYTFPKNDEAILDVEMSDDSFNYDKFNNFINSSMKFPITDNYIKKKDHSKPIKKLLCPVRGCGKRYKNINGVKIHIRKIHKKEVSLKKSKKIHKCSSCGKLYKTSHGLKKHILIHKKVSVNLDTNPPTSQSSVGHSIHQITSKYVHQTSVLNKHLRKKSKRIDEDVLHIKNEMQLSEVAETDDNESNNYFEILTPSSDGNFTINEGFASGLMFEEEFS